MYHLIKQLLFTSAIFPVKEPLFQLQLKSPPNPNSVKTVSDTLDCFDVKNLIEFSESSKWILVSLIFVIGNSFFLKN